MNESAVEMTLAQCARTELSCEMALRNLVALTTSEAELAAVIDRARSYDTRTPSGLIQRLVALYDNNKQGCAKYLQVRAAIKHAMTQNPDGLSVQQTKTLTDDLVTISERIAVASVSLDDADVLRRATEEIVDVLVRWNVVQPHFNILQIASGNGRFEQILARRVKAVHGIDISPKMVAAARRNCAGLVNAHFVESSGRDLPFADDSFELVFSMDSFPVIFNEGMEVVEGYFEETRRVLKLDGHFVLFNYSYRGEDAQDRSDVAMLAARHRFSIIENGTRPTRELWNGIAFHLQKRG